MVAQHSLRVLLIDDHVADRRLAEREVRRVHPEAIVHDTVDRETFTAALAAGEFDLVVTDCELSWDDGLAVVRAVKERRPDCPVIVFTGAGNAEAAVAAMKAGADDYVLKAPAGAARLAEAVPAALDRAPRPPPAAPPGHRLDALLDRLELGVFRTSLDGRLLEANAAFLRLLGAASLAEAQALAFGDLELPREERERMLAEPPDRRRTYEREVPLRRRDGRVVWLAVSETVGADAAGRPVVDGLVEDVTARKQAEDARRESEERLRTLVENLADFSLFMLDASGRVASWNAEAERMTGYPAAEILGQHLARLCVSASGDERDRELDAAAAGRVECERWCRRRDGSTFWARLVLTPLHDRLGGLLGFSTVIRDVSERRRAQDELVASEARLAGIIASAMDAIITVNAEERIVVFNAAAEQMFDCRAADAFGQPIDRFIPEWFRDLDRREVRAAADAGSPGTPRTLTALRASGEKFPVEATISKLGAGGQKLYTVIVRDATERMRTEADRLGLLARERAARAEAEAAQRRLAFLAEASSVLGASLDAETTLKSLAPLAVPDLGDWCLVDLVEDGRIRRLAIAHLDHRNVELGWELARRRPRVLDGRDGIAHVVRSGRAEIHTGGAAATLLLPGTDADTDPAIARLGLRSAMVVPLSAHGRTFGTMAFLAAESGRQYGPTDVALADELARRAALAFDNARLYREAQDANRAKDEFLATISHELRTPLTSIVGWVAMLRAGRLDATTSARALDVIERNAKLQAQLVEDLLDVSRIITGKLRLDTREVDLVPVIEAALESVESAANAKGIRLDSVLDPRTGPVTGDPARLQQVLWNLLSNALKFTPPAGRVEVRLSQDNGEAVITVSDTGKGIHPDARPHLFDRFWQAEGTRARTGLGLGLAIVRHLVEVHGGTVQAESPGEGLGASFTVRLPLLAPRWPRPWGRPGRESDGEDTRASVLDGVRILVVDDEHDSRDLIMTVFKDCRADVVAASSAGEAWEALQRWRPDVLVTDIRMPGETGYELLQRIRALAPEQGGTVPAVALTAQAGEDDRHRALDAGFHVHVPKPVQPGHLVAVVADLYRRTTRRALSS